MKNAWKEKVVLGFLGFVIMLSGCSLSELLGDKNPPTITLRCANQNNEVGEYYYVNGYAEDEEGQIKSVFLKLDNGNWFEVYQSLGNYSEEFHVTDYGPHTNYAYAVDMNDNRSETVMLIVDRTSVPSVQIQNPAYGFYTTNDNVLFEGTSTVDAPYTISKVELCLDGETNQTASGTTNWSKMMKLKDGQNFVHVIVTSSFGNTAVISNWIVTVNLPAPVVNAGFSNNMVTNLNAITIYGTAGIVNPYSISNVSVSVNHSAFSNCTGTTNWSANVLLSNGTNRIVIQAASDAGKTNVLYSRNIIVYQGIPVCLVNNLTNNQLIGAGFDLSVSNNDLYGIQTMTVLTNGTLYTNVQKPGAASNVRLLNVSAGYNQIKVFCRNTAGTVSATNSFDVTPAPYWSTLYGLTGSDVLMSMDADLSNRISYAANRGNTNIITKLDFYGNILWQKGLIGGSQFNCIKNTRDGGVIAAGSINMGSSNVIYVVKYTSTGSVSWQKIYKTTDYQNIHKIIETTDGYIMGGYAGNYFLILNIDNSGNVVFTKSYDSTSYSEQLRSMELTSDGGLILGVDMDAGPSSYQYLMVKLYGDYSVNWVRRIGGTSWDNPKVVKATSDGGFILSGDTLSFGPGNPTGTEYDYDIWVVKMNSLGTLVWQRAFGRTGYDNVYDMIVTPDDGCIIAGRTGYASYGGYDALLLKLDSSGYIDWQKRYGSTQTDYFQKIVPAGDGSYIVAGSSQSWTSGNYRGWITHIDSNFNMVGASFATNAELYYVTTPETNKTDSLIYTYTQSFTASVTNLTEITVTSDLMLLWGGY